MTPDRQTQNNSRMRAQQQKRKGNRDQQQRKRDALPEHLKVADELQTRLSKFGRFWGQYHESSNRFCQSEWPQRVIERVTVASLAGRDLHAATFPDEILSELNRACAAEFEPQLSRQVWESSAWHLLREALRRTFPNKNSNSFGISGNELVSEAVCWIGDHLSLFVDFKSRSSPFLNLDHADLRPLLAHLEQFTNSTIAAQELLETSKEDFKVKAVVERLRRPLHRYLMLWHLRHGPYSILEGSLMNEWIWLLEKVVAELQLSGHDSRSEGFDTIVTQQVNRFYADKYQFHVYVQKSSLWNAVYSRLAVEFPDLPAQSYGLNDEGHLVPISPDCNALITEAERWVVANLGDGLPESQVEMPSLNWGKFDARVLFEHLKNWFVERSQTRQPSINEAVGKRVADQSKQLERSRREAARNQIELTFVEHALDLKGVFGLRELDRWRTRELSEARSLAEVEAAVAEFPSLLKKFVAQRRLKSLYDEVAAEVQSLFSREMLSRFLATQLSVDRSLEQVVTAAIHLEKQLVALAEGVRRDRAVANLKLFKREMDKRAEGVEALAAVVGDLSIFDEEERQEMQRMALDAADFKKKSVFDDLLKKETGDVTRALDSES